MTNKYVGWTEQQIIFLYKQMKLNTKSDQNTQTLVHTREQNHSSNEDIMNELCNG